MQRTQLAALIASIMAGNTAAAPLDPMSASVAPAAVYGLRRINSAYAGAACQVRDSGNVLRDVVFDASGNVDQAQFAAWGDGVTFTVATWRDQSGNGRDLSSTSRPRLILSAYTDANGIARPAIDFTTKGMFLGGTASVFSSGGTANLAVFAIANTLGHSGSSGTHARPGTFASSVVAPVVSLGATSSGASVAFAAGDPMRLEGADSRAVTCYYNMRETSLDTTPLTGSGTERYRNFWFNQRGAVVSGGVDSRLAFQDRVHGQAAYGPDVLTVGANPQRTQTFNGQLTELLIYNSASPLSDVECQRIALSQRAYWGAIPAANYSTASDPYQPAVKAPLAAGAFAVAANGIHPPIQFFTPAAGTNFEIAETSAISAPYASSKMRWAWSNWYTLNDGSEPPERDTNTTIYVRATLLNAAGAKVRDLTFNGQAEATIASGDDVWCDLTDISWAGSTGYRIRTYLRYNGTRPASYRNGQDGNIGRVCASDAEALSLLNGGTITDNTFQGGVYSYGPSMAISDGWDGRPVVLIGGDSIGFGNYAARSWITEGLGSAYAGQDLPYFNICVQGTRPANSYNIDPGIFRRKDQLLRSAIALNGGRALWTSILSEAGVNDAGSTTVAGQNTLRERVSYWLKFMHYRYRPTGGKLAQTTYTPRVQPGADTSWLYSFPQTTASTTNNTATDRWVVSDWILTNPFPLSGSIDVRQDWTGSPSGLVWRDSGGVGALTAPVSSGNTYVCDTAAPVGDIAVLDAGTAASVEAVGQVLSCTGTGPFTVTVSGVVTKAHASGAVVRYATSKDGVHPLWGTVGYKAAAARVAAAKAAGVV